MFSNIFNKSCFLIAFFFVSQISYSQSSIIVKIKNNFNNDYLINKIELNASKLLTEVNLAYYEERIPNLKNIELTEDARHAILSIWETSPFQCAKALHLDNIIKRRDGTHEFRNIPLIMKFADSIDKKQEGVLIFNSKGHIDNLYLTNTDVQWSYILVDRKNVEDLRKLEFIKDFVENFRTAYNRRDIDFLNLVFSDDALIITGKVVKVYTISEEKIISNIPKEKIIYNKQSKSEYISGMKRIFSSNSYLNIKFNEVEILQHPKFPDYYGVTVKQNWNSSRYRDEGYVFLLIDLRDENSPIIHVRTWQPSIINGKSLSKDEVFNIGFFSID